MPEAAEGREKEQQDKKEHLFSSRVCGIILMRGKEIFERIAPGYGISKFINAYKSASSRLLKKEFPKIRSKLWKEAFWSQSFCLMTAGGAPIEVIRQYIESQGEKR